MKLDLKNKNDFSRVLKITATWDQIKDDYYQEFSKAKLQYQIPGFRKGKVPDNIIKKNLTPSIESKFIDHYVNVYYRKGLEELKLVPINQGNIMKIDFKESSNLEFEIAFEVRPEIKMPKYKNKVKIKTQKYIAGDQDLKDSLLDLQTRFAKTQTVDGNVKDGYFIYADFDKLDAEGNVVEGSTLKNHFIKIGEGMFSGKIGDKFIGKKAGDAVNVSITQDKSLIDYHVKINRVEEQILPELNDEFAKTVDGNFKTMTELNDSLLDKIQDNLNQENIKEFHNKIIDYFIDKTSFDIPDSMVENYKSHLTEEYKKQYTQMNQEFDESKLAETLVDTAKKTVQWILIRDLLISDEAIRVVEADISNYIKEQSEKTPEYKKDIKKYYLEDQNRYKLHEDMTNQKLYESLGAYFSNITKESPTSKLRKNKKG
jgi:trigger factor